MSLRELRQETSPGEHAQAIVEAEARLGRKLSDGERRLDIVGQDRDLRNGKQRLVDAIQAEQQRAARAWVEAGQPIHLHVTDEMVAVLADLYDAGVDHATAELKAAGVDVA